MDGWMDCRGKYEAGLTGPENRRKKDYQCDG